MTTHNLCVFHPRLTSVSTNDNKMTAREKTSKEEVKEKRDIYWVEITYALAFNTAMVTNHGYQAMVTNRYVDNVDTNTRTKRPKQNENAHLR